MVGRIKERTGESAEQIRERSRTSRSTRRSESTWRMSRSHPRGGSGRFKVSKVAHTVADHLLDRLEEWGSSHPLRVFGRWHQCIFGALDRAGDRFEFVQPRHEEMAAFMAGALPSSPTKMYRRLPGHVTPAPSIS